MRWSRFFDRLLRVLFVLYCFEAGVFLTLAPWREAWGQLLMHFPWSEARLWLQAPLARGAVSGFGLVHLVFGLHDFRDLFFNSRRRKPPDEAAAAPLVGDHQR